MENIRQTIRLKTTLVIHILNKEIKIIQKETNMKIQLTNSNKVIETIENHTTRFIVHINFKNQQPQQVPLNNQVPLTTFYQATYIVIALLKATIEE